MGIYMAINSKENVDFMGFPVDKMGILMGISLRWGFLWDEY